MSEPWPFWRRYLNLAQPRLGARVTSVSDDFFGAADRLIQAEEPIWVPGKYDDHGKWMDGWESRRRRDQGYDWCVVQLGAPSRIYGIDIDTRHFNGNQPQAATLDGALTGTGVAPAHDSADWFELVPRVPLDANSQHRHEVALERTVDYLRLNIFPDGGVARLRAYGLVEHDWARQGETLGDRLVDLAAAKNGGCVVAASDEHFGAAGNLLLPDRGLHMGDGWETARRRGPGHDWVLLELGCPGTVEQLVLDTAHFKGNFPHQCTVEAALDPDLSHLSERSGHAESGGECDLDTKSFAGADRVHVRDDETCEWTELLPRMLMQPDQEHTVEAAGPRDAIYSHVRLSIFPDGGVSRLRVLGRPRPTSRADRTSP